jgi:hypothetical protein
MKIIGNIVFWSYVFVLVFIAPSWCGHARAQSPTPHRFSLVMTNGTDRPISVIEHSTDKIVGEYPIAYPPETHIASNVIPKDMLIVYPPPRLRLVERDVFDGVSFLVVSDNVTHAEIVRSGNGLVVLPSVTSAPPPPTNGTWNGGWGITNNLVTNTLSITNWKTWTTNWWSATNNATTPTIEDNVDHGVYIPHPPIKQWWDGPPSVTLLSISSNLPTMEMDAASPAYHTNDHGVYTHPPRGVRVGDLCHVKGNTNQFKVVWVVPDGPQVFNQMVGGAVTNDAPGFIAVSPVDDPSTMLVFPN